MPVSDSIPLARALVNSIAVVAQVDVPIDDGARLMALGLCTGRKVQVVKQGDPLIVLVMGARVGLSARLADMVMVRPCEPTVVSSAG